MLNYIGFTKNCSTEDFKTSEAQVWVGVKIPRPRYLDHHPVFLTHCAISYLRPFGKCKYLRNNYYAKLHWFYNYSSEYFRNSEAQVWVGVKIPRPRYLDPHPVFLTHCAISYQDRLENANI